MAPARCQLFTVILSVVLGLGTLSSGSVVELGGPAKEASFGDEPGELSHERLGFYPRFGGFGELLMHGQAKPMLRARQSGNIESDCNPGYHSCAGLQQDGCCQNTHYCFVDSTGVGKCCPLGTQCNADPCPTSSYFCTATVTRLATFTPTGVTTPTSAMVTTSSTGCCIRACLLSYHSCASSFGGNCCGNESACIPGNKCTRTPGPTATSFVPSANACSSSSFLCSDGGCCPNGYQCTQSASVAGCTQSGASSITRSIINGNGIATGSATVTPTDGGSGSIASGSGSGGQSTNNSGGLTTGAKVGIAVGSIAVVALVIGLGFYAYSKKKPSNVPAGPNMVEQPPAVPPPGYQPQSPYPMSPPPVQQQQYFNQTPQQYQPYSPPLDPTTQGYYAPQSPSAKPSPHQRPASEVHGSTGFSSPQQHPVHPQPSQNQAQELQA